MTLHRSQRLDAFEEQAARVQDDAQRLNEALPQLRRGLWPQAVSA
jgi:ubiquinone biosynthesis protein UbiJ